MTSTTQASSTQTDISILYGQAAIRLTDVQAQSRLGEYNDAALTDYDSKDFDYEALGKKIVTQLTGVFPELLPDQISKLSESIVTVYIGLDDNFQALASLDINADSFSDKEIQGLISHLIVKDPNTKLPVRAPTTSSEQVDSISNFLTQKLTTGFENSIDESVNNLWIAYKSEDFDKKNITLLDLARFHEQQKYIPETLRDNPQLFSQVLLYVRENYSATDRDTIQKVHNIISAAGELAKLDEFIDLVEGGPEESNWNSLLKIIDVMSDLKQKAPTTYQGTLIFFENNSHAFEDISNSIKDSKKLTVDQFVSLVQDEIEALLPKEEKARSDSEKNSSVDTALRLAETGRTRDAYKQELLETDNQLQESQDVRKATEEEEGLKLQVEYPRIR